MRAIRLDVLSGPARTAISTRSAIRSTTASVCRISRETDGNAARNSGSTGINACVA
ncbi:hypothetical protein D9M72_611790 [compost metagenome]